jgi:hypothetical protein
MEIPLVEITPLPLVLEDSARPFELLTVDIPVHRDTGGGRGQRAAAEPAAAHRQAAGAEPHQDGETAAESDASGEPRRRRRRSSASI